MPSQIEQAKQLIQDLIDACEARMARIPDHAPRLREEQFRYQYIQAGLHNAASGLYAQQIAEKALKELPERLAELRGPVTW